MKNRQKAATKQQSQGCFEHQRKHSMLTRRASHKRLAPTIPINDEDHVKEIEEALDEPINASSQQRNLKGADRQHRMNVNSVRDRSHSFPEIR